MLSNLRPKEIDDIRLQFGSNILYNAIKEACRDCCALLESYVVRQEHIFVYVIQYIDDLKEYQEDIDWNQLYTDIYQDYRYIASQAIEDDLRIIAATIICSLSSILAIAKPTYYHSLAKNLLQQVLTHNNQLPREQLFSLMDLMEKHNEEISQWMDDYMHSDEFLSDNIQKLLLPTEEQICREPKHILFTVYASQNMRDEFKSVLTKVINSPKAYGKAEAVKNILKKYKDDGIIILTGKQIDIFRDLCDCFHYKQDRSTFYSASPQLPEKQE